MRHLLDDVRLRCRELFVALAAAEGPAAPLQTQTLEQRVLLSATPLPSPEAGTSDESPSGRVEPSGAAADAFAAAVSSEAFSLADSEFAALLAWQDAAGTERNSDRSASGVTTGATLTLDPAAAFAATDTTIATATFDTTGLAEATSSEATSSEAASSEAASSEAASSDAASSDVAVRRELVFVDAGLADLDRLLSDLWSWSDPAIERTVVLLPGSGDGLERIGQTLAAQSQPVDAVHILSHATERAVKLGDGWIDRAALAERADEVAAWDAALADGADLLFYGCDLAATADGRGLLADFATLAGADLAASTNDTGADALGGDWTLEHRLGTVESTLAVTASGQRNWSGLMNTFTVTTTADAGAGSLRQAILDANALAGYDTIDFAIDGSEAFAGGGGHGATNFNGDAIYLIELATDLPTITDALLIDATTQTGYTSVPVVWLSHGSFGGIGFEFADQAESVGNATGASGFSINDFATAIVAGQDGSEFTANWIGLDPNGTFGSRVDEGIRIRGDDVVVGTPTSGNRLAGRNDSIAYAGASTGSVIQNNVFGLGADGTTDLGSGTHVNIDADHDGALIGGSGGNRGNAFHNADYAVYVADAAAEGNRIIGNTAFGISLTTIRLGGWVPNDALDADTGANTLINRPIPIDAISDDSSTLVDLVYRGAPNETLIFDFFASNPATFASGSETHVYLGSAIDATDASGEVRVRRVINAAVAAGWTVNATATDSGGNTSQVGQWQPITKLTGDGIPLARADHYLVDRLAGGPLTVDAVAGVLANDRIARDTALQAVLVAGPARYESFSLGSDGSFTFEPQAGESASTLTFQYYATDGTNDSATQTVTFYLHDTTAGLVGDVEQRIDTGIGYYRATETSGRSVAATADGGAVIVSRTTQHDGLGYRIHLQRVDANGAAVGAKQTVGRFDTEQIDPSVAVAADGTIAVAWQSTAHGGGSGVYVQTFDAGLNALGTPQLVHTDNGDYEEAPTVAALPSGNFLVGYLTDEGVGGLRHTYYTIVDTTGATVSGPTRLQGTLDEWSHAAIGHAGGIAFATIEDFANPQVRLILQSEGGIATRDVTITDDAFVSTPDFVQLVELPAGGFAAVWVNGGIDLNLQRFDASGAVDGTPLTLTTATKILSTSLAVEADGTLAIGFGTASTTFAPNAEAVRLVRVAPDDTVIGESDFRRYLYGHRSGPGLAVLDGGELLAVSSGEGPGGNRGTYTQTLSDTAAAPPATYSVSGTVAEDHDADGDIAEAGTVGVQASVRLWRDNGDGIANAADTLVGVGTSSAANGSYSFAGLHDGLYYFAVDAKSVVPSAGFNVGFDQGDVWAVRTALDGAVENASGTEDFADITTVHHLTHITVSGADETGHDAGFSFEAIDTTADGDDDLAADRSVQGSLRQFLQNANAIAGAATSRFLLQTDDPNYSNPRYLFTLGSLLPAVSDEVTLDGSTQSGFAASPIIEIDAAGVAYGLVVDADDSAVRSVAVGGASVVGLLLRGDGIALESSYVGLRADGSTANANADGLLVEGDSVTIGGVGVGNVVSGNTDDGIQIDAAGIDVSVVGNIVGLAADGDTIRGNGDDGVDGNTYGSLTVVGNTIAGSADHGIRSNALTGDLVVRGNRIGTNAAGTAVRGFGGRGIFVSDLVGQLQIGGTAPADLNVIGGAIDGISINDGTLSAGSYIDGNLIGIGADGTTDVGNVNTGVAITRTSGVVIGTAGNGNFIGGGGFSGIYLFQTDGASVLSNTIGLGTDGTTDLGNGHSGLTIDDSDNIVIGAAGAGNVVVNNAFHGLSLHNLDGVTIEANRIGLTAADVAAGNGLSGIYLDRVDNAVVGNGAASGRNVIGSNTQHGILVDAAGMRVTINDNFIGTASDGTTARGNGLQGIRIVDASQVLVDQTVIVASGGFGIRSTMTAGTLTVTDSHIGVDVGGNAGIANAFGGVSIESFTGTVRIGGAGDRNVIAGNTGHGISITDSALAAGSFIDGNTIGLGADGSTLLGNTQDGIYVANSSQLAIGTAGLGNVIAGNDRDGVQLSDAASVTMAANVIGLAADRVTTRGNGRNGVHAVDSDGLSLGLSGAGNLIAANASNGIFLDGTTNTTVRGNTIGLDDNDAAAGNGEDGIVVFDASTGIVIGGTDAADRNVIAANAIHGISGSTNSQAVVLGNFIGTDSTGQLDRGNAGSGINVVAASDGWTIGQSGAGNVIAGNAGHGIRSHGSTDHTIDGNTIGLAADGTTLRTNDGDAVLLIGASNTQLGTAGVGNRIASGGTGGVGIDGGDGITVHGNDIGFVGGAFVMTDEAVIVVNATNLAIGGDAAGEGNTLGSGGSDAVAIGDGAATVTVAGNTILTDASGPGGTGPGGHGVLVHGTAADVLIGGPSLAAGNAFLSVAGDAVRIAADGTDRPSGVVVQQNSYVSLSGTFIDLVDAGDANAPVGLNPNDAGDADTGVNGLQNHPTIDSVRTYHDGTEITFTLQTTANTSVRVDLYVRSGGATTFLAGLSGPTNGSGRFGFTTPRLPGIDPGDEVTATATNVTTGETSEFAVPVAAVYANTAPTAAAESYNATEDQTLFVAAASGVLDNDTDPDTGDTLTAALVTGPSNAASFTLNADGSFSYRAAADYNGPDSFTYRAFDGTDSSATVTVDLSVAAVNDPPVAAADSYAATEDQTLAVNAAAGVLDNDSDVDGDAITAELVTGPSHAATFSLNADGSFTYRATADYNGPDSFTYRAFDGAVYSATVTVDLPVAAVNDPPVAADDSYAATEDQTLTVDAAAGVLDNDSDVDGDTLTAELVAGPSNATNFTLNADGSFSYRAAADYNGPDSFTYRTFDGTAYSAAVTVDLPVAAVNDPPVASADSYAATEDQTLTVNAAAGVLDNDSDVDGDALTSELVAGPVNAAAFSLNADGSFSYRATADYNGPDSFSYRTFDGTDYSTTVTVDLSVAAVNDPPVAAADSYAATEDQTLAVDAATGVLDNDSDIDGDMLTAELVAGPANAESFTLNADGSFSYRATADYNGPDSFSYRTFDRTTYSATVTVDLSVAAVNDAPVAAADSYAATEDQPLTVDAAVGVLDNDSDVDGDTLTVELVAGPDHAATFALNADGSFTYLATADYNGPDSFAYRTFDGTAFSATVTVDLPVAAANDAPTLGALALETDEDSPLAIPTADLLATAADIDGDPLAVRIVDAPAFGTLTPTADGYVYTPSADFHGTDGFTFAVSDGTAESAAAAVTLTVHPVNDAPAGSDLSLTLDEQSIDLTVAELIANAVDRDADELTVVVVDGPSHGTLQAVAAGFRYTPTPGFVGVDTFSYQLSDGAALSMPIEVAIDVQLGALAPPPSDAGGNGGSGGSDDGDRFDSGDGSSSATSSATSSAAGGEPTLERDRGASESPTRSAAAVTTARAADPSPSRGSDAAGEGVAPAAVAGAVRQQSQGDEEDELFGPLREAESAIAFSVAELMQRAVAAEAGGSSAGSALRRAALAEAMGHSSLRTWHSAHEFGLAYSDEASVQAFISQMGYLKLLDESRTEVEKTVVDRQWAAGTAVASGAAVSVGYAMWLARGGFLFAGVVTALPSWHLVDPLPVLREFRGDQSDLAAGGEGDAEDDLPLDHLLGRG